MQQGGSNASHPTGQIGSKLEAGPLDRSTSHTARPLSEVAKYLGYDQSFWYKHFSELCRAISDRYRVYRKKQREERKLKILKEVRQATYSVYARGLYPSQERVRFLLAKPGSIREPGALAVWHETLAELGKKNRGT